MYFKFLIPILLIVLFSGCTSLVQTKLYEAVNEGDLKIVKEEVEGGAFIKDPIDPLINHSLYWTSAPKDKKMEVTEYLINKGISFNDCDFMYVMRSRELKSIAVVEAMLKHNGDIFGRCKGLGKIYTRVSHLEKIKLMEKYGGLKKTDLTNLKPESFVDPDIVDYLVLSGVKLNKLDKYGNNELMICAVFNCNANVIEQFIKNGIDVNAKTKFNSTALHHTVEHVSTMYKDNEFKIIDMLIENGADITIKNNDGKTAVESALTSDLAHRILDTSERVAIEKYKKGLLSIEDIRRLGKIITEQRGKIVTIYVKVDKQERVNPITSFFNTVGDVVAGAGNVAGNVINGLGSSNALGNYKAKTDTSTYLKDSSKQIHERYNSLKAITESNNTVKDSSSNSISNMTPEEQGYKERLVTRTINNKAEVKKEVKEEIKKEERYDYKLVEAMTYVWKSGEYWYAYGKNGNMIQLRSEAEALSSTDCSPRGLGVSHTYDGKKGNVYYCGEPLNKVGFGSSDLAGRYGVGPGLTNSRKVWNCKTQSPGNSWQNLCKDY